MGGNAIKLASRINQENVSFTVNDIYEYLEKEFNISSSDMSLIGSAGKKMKNGTSGDIDIAIQINSFLKNNDIDNEKMFDYVYNKLNETFLEIKDIRSLGLMSFSFPIKNIDSKQPNKFVQVDLLFVDSIEWAKWAFYSPHERESPWKALYRNEILYAIAKYMDYIVLEEDPNIGNIWTRWERNFFDLNRGLMRGVQSRIGKKKLLKIPNTESKWVVSNIPEIVVKMMFDDYTTPDDVLTWEQTFLKIQNKNFKHKKLLYHILIMTEKGIKEKGYLVPDELNNLLKDYFM